MDEKIEQYQKQLDEKRNQLIGFTSTMEEIIGKYVFEYGIRPLKLKRDRKIAFLKHNYDAAIIDRKFLQEKPNDYQVNRSYAKESYNLFYLF